MRYCFITIILLSWLLIAPVAAQDKPPLILSDTQIGAQPDGFGGETPAAFGELYNHGDAAYSNINIYLEAIDADRNVIGEGFGFLVDACGTALLDYALPPGRKQRFSAPFELFEEGTVESLKFSFEADPAETAAPPAPDAPGVHGIANDEVVMLEWLDDDNLIYGVGCDGTVFTELEWWQYNVDNHALSATTHPDAQRVTPEMILRSDAAMITQSGEQNPQLFFGSQMTYPPGARRIVYQNDLHTIFSAEPDGSYKRLIHDGLHKHSLRGFVWAHQPGVFSAHYFGAYGEPVYYFNAHVDGRMLMGRLEELPPSLTIPGPAPDGLAVVVGRQTEQISGYYWDNAYGGRELLFEAELPGNNYPAPIVTSDRIYLIRPIEGVATLQCFHRRSRELSTITALPLRLTRESRAWSWLSPDGGKLALAANGTEGGVWWVDLAGVC